MGTLTIKVPDLGEGIAEVELVAWRVQPGDTVAEDQVLADVMTDKATVEIPSPVAGRVLALGGEVGQQIAVGAELIRIDVAAGGEAKEAVPVVSAPAPAAVPAPAPAERARPAAGKPLAAPAVRHRAAVLGIDLRQVPGSSADGRILHEDLDAWLLRRPGPPAPDAARYAERNDEEAVPVTGVRRRIAQRMQDAMRRIPHFTYVEEVDVTELELLRARINERWGGERAHLTLLPLLVRAVVLAVPRFPQINARFDDEAGVLTRHGAVHVGIATQTAAGLMVPVLRHAEARDLWSSATEIARLADAARAGRATRDELSGSTLTVTSLGALGGIASTPIINAPEVAIVGVNRIVQRPVMLGDAVVARRMMNLSSSFDHRVVDGQLAAEFVQAVRASLECPALLFIE
ncbi:2-oxoisovalerate dehydrogenase E2 component (dihydrolipoyl transacylase) [Variovorax boronicumulans]|uniref:dihydrolipoamide acetyltransferase family protein n=1 Tax=Variovorax boronicumulans TaxID=436515 RepID=UPI00278ABBCB|nr:dihydrolipoamide acetyltransferase family protein [Variovorax boronicumulans]MDP9917972.1 2-oxoisovalerate dehydrogenase E2 component (dihydrolipoyl transacylase) [Variovorax boronicumulans]